MRWVDIAAGVCSIATAAFYAHSTYTAARNEARWAKARERKRKRKKRHRRETRGVPAGTSCPFSMVYVELEQCLRK